MIHLHLTNNLYIYLFDANQVNRGLKYLRKIGTYRNTKFFIPIHLPSNEIPRLAITLT